MKESLKEKLRNLSKDDDSFDELRHLFGSFEEERNQFKQHLNLLEQVIENDYDSIVITGLEIEKPGPKIVYVNKGFTNITGYRRDEIIGKTPRILQGPKTDRETLDRLKSRLKAGRAFFGQAVNYRKDGSEFFNQWDIHPLMDEQGNISHWVAYMHDITERRRAEKTVINTHASFNDLRKNAKSTMLDVNTDGSIRSANKSFRNLTGYKKDELHGRKVWELFPRKYRISLKTRFDKKFDKTDFHNQSLKGIIKHKKGLPIQIEGISTVLELQEGTIIRAEIKNISLQKRIMQTLQKRKEDYSNIVEQVSQFTYRMSMKDGEAVIDYLSDAFSTVTGLPVDALVACGKWEKIVHEDDIPKVRNHLKKVLKGSTRVCEYRIKMGDGSYQKIMDNAKPGTCKKSGEEKCVRGAVSFLQEEEPAQIQ